MPLNESIQSTIGILWLMIIAIIVCIILRSPWVVLFAFIFVFNFLGLVKSFTTEGAKHQQQHGEEDAVDEVELQPLEKMDIKNMTLGELLNKY